MNKKKFAIGVSFLLLYFLLILLLLAAEGANPDSGINSLQDAIWYSLVTMTTVGYGDIYPSTILGRIIAAFFMFMSLGLFAILVGTAVTVVRDRFIPWFRLMLSSSKKWYVFDGDDTTARTIATGIRKNLHDPVCIFQFEGPEPPNLRGLGLAVPFSTDTLLRMKKKTADLSLFFTSGSETENLSHALENADKECQVYAMTELLTDELPKNVTTFSPNTCLARLYWREYPLEDMREKIVLIGSGACADSLLEQALLVNVVDPAQSVCYYVYGESDSFQKNHHMLSAFLDIDQATMNRDAIFFGGANWQKDAKIIEQADRILLCDDDKAKNAEILTTLKRFYPMRGKLFARLSAPAPGVITFGGPEQIFTPELVMSKRLDQTAMLMNDIYVRSSGGQGKPWEALSDFARRSNQASADHLRVKIGLLLGERVQGDVTPALCKKAYEVYASKKAENAEWYRRLEHERWDRFHYVNNWSYADVRNNALRKHPLLKTFEELPLSEQAKDDYAWELLKSFAEN
ncbi:MAG: ion transporter [Acetatifactor sp.]|nr:ion transporter [Acetatifactor sp.]